MEVVLPTFIGLVGNPTAGKSTAAEILQEVFGCQIIETGRPLREIAMHYLGLTRDQVYTQEGKKEFVEILGKQWQVRDILGTLGQKLEDMFGEEVMPMMAHMTIKSTQGKTFVDPSCRKVQPHYWKRQGGIIIEINNPNAPPSQYAFDQFDRSAVDYTVNNDWSSRGLNDVSGRLDLRDKLMSVLVNHSLSKAA